MSKTPIGNVTGFGKDVLYNIVYLLGIGYIGGSVTAICNSSKIDKLFPYDETKSPYIGQKPVGIINSLIGAPYGFRKEPGTIYNEYFNWYIDTWAYVFSFWREIYAHGAYAGKDYLYPDLFGNLLLFYASPYILFYMTSIIPYISFVLAGIGSMLKEYSFMFTFAAITAWGYGIGKCDEIGIGCLLNTFMLGMTGIILSFTYIPWWIIISVATYIYFGTFLVFSPFFANAPGLSVVFKEILKHKSSLTIIFMLLTLRASTTYLVPQVTSGLGICLLYILYTLYKNNKVK
jgi:hypothetical protein